MTASSIVKRFQDIKHHIHKLAGKHQHVRIVAVSKTYPADAIVELHKSKAKHEHFGENYVAECVKKALELKKYHDIKWHFIGHLQSNKADTLVNGVPNLWCVETVDRPKIAHALNKAAEKAIALKKRGDPLNVMVQVNTSDEPQKSGCMIQNVVPLVNTIRYDCPALRFIGLMTIGSVTNSSVKHANPDFEKLVACRNTVCAATGLRENDVELSMGMSADYEEAIKQGSTNIRIGSAIFGPRKNVKASETVTATSEEGASESTVYPQVQQKDQNEQLAGEKTTITLAERKVGNHVEAELQVTKEHLPGDNIPDAPKKKGFQPADIDFSAQQSPSKVPDNVVAVGNTPATPHPDPNRPAEAPPLPDDLKPTGSATIPEKELKVEENIVKQVEAEVSVKKTEAADGDEIEEMIHITKRSGVNNADIAPEDFNEDGTLKQVVNVQRVEASYASSEADIDTSKAKVIRIAPTIKRIVKRIDLDGNEVVLSTEEFQTGEDTSIIESKEKDLTQ